MVSIKNHPNYSVTDDGRVYRKPNLSLGYRYLTPDISTGYKRVDLDGTKEYIARLVLEAFDPPINDSYKVFYIDGDKMNCDLGNLVWLTPSEIQLYSQYTPEYRRQFLGRW